MSTGDLAALDPKWAWAPYQSSAQQPWNIRRAAHLHRRLGFGADWSRLQKTAAGNPQEAVEALFNAAPMAASELKSTAASIPGAGAMGGFDMQMSQLGQVMLAGNDSRSLSAWWLYRMVNTTDPLTERVALCWHGHFATSAAKVPKPHLMLAQNQLLRRHGLGDFHQMVLGISRDPAMLIWLDSTTNRRIHPNENYAREVMELFCLGPGHYTEKDIAEVARCFTGWEVHGERFVFNGYQHDTAAKRFLGATGNYDGGDAVDIILKQPAAGRFIAGKLAKWLVAEEPELPARLIAPLADALMHNGFQIGPVVKTIAASNLFFSHHAIGRKVRSPVDLGIGLLRALEGATDLNYLAQRLEMLGQAVFYPPNVKGWEGGRTWIDASTLLGRTNLVHELVLEGRARFGEGGLGALADRHGIRGDKQTVDWLIDLLLAAPPPDSVRSMLVDLAGQAAPDGDQRLGRLIHALACLPEFQLG